MQRSSRSRGRSRSRSRERDRTLRVSNLSRNVSDAHLAEIFRHYGRVEAVDMPLAPRPAVAGLPVGHAFVTMESPRDAEDAEDCMDDGIVDGERVTVELVPTRTREREGRDARRRRSPSHEGRRRGAPPPRGGRSRSPERGHGRRDRSR